MSNQSYNESVEEQWELFVSLAAKSGLIISAYVNGYSYIDRVNQESPYPVQLRNLSVMFGCNLIPNRSINFINHDNYSPNSCHDDSVIEELNSTEDKKVVPVEDKKDADDTKVVPVEEPKDAEDKKVVPVEEPKDDEDKKVVPVEEPKGAEDKKVVPVEEPKDADDTKVVPVEEPKGAEDKQVVPVEDKKGADDTKVVPVEKPKGADDTKVIQVEEPKGAEDKKVVPVEKPKGAEDKQVVPVEEPTKSAKAIKVKLNEPTLVVDTKEPTKEFTYKPLESIEQIKKYKTFSNDITYAIRYFGIKELKYFSENSCLYNFYNSCWNNYNTNLTWDFIKGTIKLSSDTNKNLNECLLNLAIKLKEIKEEC
jgi:hypothetical protein